jgi:predicted hotdog family 3-hydroxylacyl-ACP dehydratase
MNVSTLSDWIPHRPPMVWVDEVLSVTADGGECIVRLKPEALYNSSTGIRQSSALEFVAQSFGYIRAAQYVQGLFPKVALPKQVFLVGIRNATFFHQEKKATLFVRVKIKGIRPMAMLTLFEGVVENEDDLKLFEANVKVYSV